MTTAVMPFSRLMDNFFAPTSCTARDDHAAQHLAPRADILEGGDNSGRGTVVGAVLGAAYGVPSEWAQKTGAVEIAAPLLDRLN